MKKFDYVKNSFGMENSKLKIIEGILNELLEKLGLTINHTLEGREGVVYINPVSYTHLTLPTNREV